MSWCPGGVQLHGVHRHSGPAAPHSGGLLQDALGVQHRGTSRLLAFQNLPGHPTTVFCCFSFFWLQVVIMACREFEMGKVTMFPAIPFHLPSPSPAAVCLTTSLHLRPSVRDRFGFSAHFGLGFKICVQMCL